MKKTTKMTLWVVAVCLCMSGAVYFAGCGDDAATDAGTGGGGGGSDVGGGGGSDVGGGGGSDAGGGEECTAEGDACEGGTCFAETGGALACYLSCDVVGDACDSGTCYFVGEATGEFYCGETGTIDVGDECATATDCVEGVQCLEQGGTMTCYQICTDTCDAGDCTDTELGFNVCVVP